MFMRVLQVTGAYGRSYDNAQMAVYDWFGGRDFMIIDGPYCSSRDENRLVQDGYSHVHIIDIDSRRTLAIVMLGSLDN
jgi:hypothetical protein